MKKQLKDYFLIALGSFVLAVGLNMFLVPSKISSGGVSSIGTVLLYVANVPLSVTNLMCNALLFVFGYKYLGKSSVLKTIAGIIFLSVFLEITKAFPEVSDDMFIATVIGGFLIGIGVGLVVRVEASTGGSDFAGLILKKFFAHIPLATIILMIDSVIIIFAGIVFRDYMVVFYSAIAMFIASKVTDEIINIGDAAKSVYIMSKKNSEIAKMIIEAFERGATGIYSRGVYSQTDNMTLLCAVSPKQLPSLVNKIREIDKSAFIIVSDAREVLGEGFKEVN